MALFYRRPLAAACFTCIVAVFAAWLLPFVALIILLCASCLAAVLLLFLHARKREAYVRFLLLLLVLGTVFGLGRVFAWQRQATSVIKGRSGATVYAEATIEKVIYRTAYEASFVATLDALDHTACDVRVVLDFNGSAPFGVGDKLGGQFNVSYTLNDDIDQASKTELISKEACARLTATPESTVDLLESGSNTLSERLQDFRYLMHHSIASSIGGEAGELTGALLLGTKDALHQTTVRDFRNAGISHLLSISGLHLVIVAAILERVLCLLGVRKKLRILIFFVFFAGYLFLTGFLFSMMRAVFMIMLLQIAFWVGGRYDAFTALCLGGALILMITPGAVFDISFQLTMLATFGILAFGALHGFVLYRIPVKSGWRYLPLRLLRVIFSSFLITAFATVAILPVQWLIFGEISLITPLSNLLVIPLATPLLTCGLLLAFLGCLQFPIWPLALFVRLIANVMLGLAARLSEIGGVLSLKYAFVPFIFLPLFVLTAVLLVIRLKRKRLWLTTLPMLTAAVVFAICLSVTYAVGGQRVQAIYETTGSNDGLVLVQNGTAMICDLSNGSYSQLMCHYDLARQDHACEVAVLLLTHYHKQEDAALMRFCNAVRVNALWLPEPETAEDAALLSDILLIALAQDVAVTVYERGKPLTVFETGTLTVSPTIKKSRSTEPAFYMDVTFGKRTLRYESAAYSEYVDRKEGDTEKKTTVNCLILGGHGPKPHAPVIVSGMRKLDEIWLSNTDTIKWHIPLQGINYVVEPKVRVFTLE